MRSALPAKGSTRTLAAACGIEGILDVEYDYDVARRSMKERGLGATPSDRLGSIWRYLDLLPVTGDAGLPKLQVGGTPIVDAPRLAKQAGVAALALKDDGRLPTGSFKDRASAVGTTKARELGFKTIACSSTGNAASSLAGFCADAGLEAIIFVPAHAPPAKVAQLRAFGATVLLVEGSYDQAYYLTCEDACRAHGWYDRNCAVNPYLVEGKKTCGVEIGEQLAKDPRDWVAVALGDGCTTGGIWKGMRRDARAGHPPEKLRADHLRRAGGRRGPSCEGVECEELRRRRRLRESEGRDGRR